MGDTKRVALVILVSRGRPAGRFNTHKIADRVVAQLHGRWCVTTRRLDVDRDRPVLRIVGDVKVPSTQGAAVRLVIWDREPYDTAEGVVLHVGRPGPSRVGNGSNERTAWIDR